MQLENPDVARLPQIHYSAGIHPWYIGELNWKKQLDLLCAKAHEPNIIAIGECGLDRLCETPITIQTAVFREQIALANRVAKPMIIHNVRYHREIIQLLMECQNNMPVIFHGFNQQKDVADALLKFGCYLSFGKSLFRPAMEPVFSSIPIDRLFLETDDSDLSIFDIYRKAASIRQIGIDTLLHAVQKNFYALFPDK